MPNHVTSELVAAKHIIDSLRSGDSELDFEAVVPMPEVMKGEPHMGITQWAQIAMGVINLKTLAEPTPDNFAGAASRLEQQNAIRALQEGPYPIDYSDVDFEQLLKCMRALKDYGHTSWYEWSIANWGTKWNAYGISRINDTTIRFQTAWSPPLKWIEKLVEKFPGEETTIRWADEDFGNNVGILTVKSDGTASIDNIQNDSPEAHRIAMDLVYDGEVPEHMRPEPDGRYSYVDE